MVEALVRWDSLCVVQDNVSFADKGQEHAKSKDRYGKRNETGVHEAHKKLQAHNGHLCGQINGEHAHELVRFLLNGWVSRIHI